MAADPSYNVHPELLSHIHLISAYRYPLVPRFGIPDVTEWLLNAPRIAREGAPFFWTYLEAPQDGTILLTWQPLQRMGTEFATDGYVWPRGELYYQHEIRDGLILEVFHQPVGFRPDEEFATHSRRRFRLMPPKVPNPNAPPVDPSLWLVHYGPADEREPPAVKKIRLDPRLRSLLDHRNNLQRAGQIARKDFMLSDRVNWPQIPLPRDARGPPVYAGGMGPGGIPQQMAYPPHAGAPGAAGMPQQPPAKRARHHPSSVAQAQAHAQAAQAHQAQAQAQAQAAAAAAAAAPPMDVAVYEDEEDTSRGDLFDVITPRDVSLERYKQNHEWMEELISSPYRIGQIGYADLGLGRKGELAAVTDGIFESQAFDAFQSVPKKPYVGRLDADLANEFRARVQKKVEETNAEIAAMEARHAQLVEAFMVNSVAKKAIAELQAATDIDAIPLPGGGGSGSGSGSPAEGGGGVVSSVSDGDGGAKPADQRTADEVLAAVEGELGRKVAVSGGVVRVQDGGYREPSPEPIVAPVPELVPEPVPESTMMQGVPTISTTLVAPGGPATGSAAAPSPAGSQLSGILVGDADMDMGDTAAGMLDQMESVFSPAASTPGNNNNNNNNNQFGAQQQQQQQAPGGGVGPSPLGQQPSVNAGATPGATGQLAPGGAAASATSTGGGEGATGTGTAPGGDDWVVVPPGGGTSPSAGGGAVASAAAAAAAAAAAGTSSASGGSAANTLAPPSKAATTSGNSQAGSTAGGDFGALEDLDTAGEALASMDEGLDLDMDDSAFGDAFHGSGGD